MPAVAPAVTNPVLDTVAMEVFDETHGLDAAAVPDPFNCEVAPGQTVSVPVMEGKGSTVNVTVA